MAYHVENVLMDDVEESPIVTFYPIFNRSDYSVVYDNAYDKQYAIQIGVIDDSTHYGVGGALSYFTLFSLLESDGYDPLYPIRGEKAKEHTGRAIGSIIASLAKTDSSQRIYNRVAAYARQICNFVRDYIYGSRSVPSFGSDISNAKAPLAKETIYKRRAKLKKDPSLYDGERGIQEPLYETGELCNAIKWRLVPVDVVGGSVVAERFRRSSSAELREREKKSARERKRVKTTKEMRRASDTEEERKIAKEKKKALASRSIFEKREEWLKTKLQFYLKWIRVKDAHNFDPEFGYIPSNQVSTAIQNAEKEAYSYGITREELKGFKS